MVEINFIEKQKINVVPYIIAVVFVLLLVLVASILLWQHGSKEEQLNSLELEIQQNLEKQQELTSLKNIKEQRLQLKEQLISVEDSIFPTIPLLDRMIALLPENTYFNHFSFSIKDGLSIDIRVEDMTQAAAYSNAIRQQSFVENVTFAKMDKVQSDDAYYLASFQIKIDEQAWIEEVGQQ